MMYKGYGLEADLVLHLDDGRYALIECKLGSREKTRVRDNAMLMPSIPTNSRLCHSDKGGHIVIGHWL